MSNNCLIEKHVAYITPRKYWVKCPDPERCLHRCRYHSHGNHCGRMDNHTTIRTNDCTLNNGDYTLIINDQTERLNTGSFPRS